jgi:transposase
MQCDFVVFRRGANPLYAFTATLGFSRWRCARFTSNEQADTLITCHHALFDTLGGVPREILYDNAKTIVDTRDAYAQGHHRWHPGMLGLAKRYGFLPRLCRPYRAQTKGEVERFHRYLRGNFYVPLSSWLKQSGLVLDVDTANAEVGKWLRDVANQRIHPITRAAPAVLFDQQERQTLRPLPAFVVTPSLAEILPPIIDPGLPLQHSLAVYQQLLTEVHA